MGRNFNEIEQSGDVGVEAWGETERELFENVTHGLFTLQCHEKLPSSVTRQLQVTSHGLDAAMVDWLNEVIASGQAHGELYGEVRIKHVGADSVEGEVSGDSVAGGAYATRHSVKAATYRRLRVGRREQGDRAGAKRGFFARVIFDL